MQISYVGQYNSSAGQAVGTPVPASPAQVSSLTAAAVGELSPGSIFEGNVTYVKGQNVILSLENGQNIHARLDSRSLKLSPGQSMFFQVKSNEGGTVSIRPYMGGTASNPTLMRALQAAGLPTNGRNLAMVDAMMREQMPIHAEALQDMHRVIASNEGIGVDTLVQMTRLGLPVTPQMAAQFENYRNDSHLLLGQIDAFLEELPEFLEEQSADVPRAVELHSRLLSILSGQPAESSGGVSDNPADPAQSVHFNAAEDAPRTGLPETMAENARAAFAANGEDAGPEGLRGMFFSEIADGDGERPAFAPNQVGALLGEEMREGLADVLRSIGNLVENEAVFDEEGNLNGNLTARELLGWIGRELQEQRASLEWDDLKDLFSQKGYRKLLSGMMEEQWTLRPEDVRSKEKVEDLYERLERQLQQVDRLLKAAGSEHSPLARAAEQIRSNVQFMNEVNQIYNYVQIPLKMNGQNANGDLYVYTNKKRLRDDDGELTAFLHLDMQYLGSTDVYVKMQGKALSTNFSFSDDASFALVQKYLPILEAKLEALGYRTTLTVKSGVEKPDFVDDFLKRDLPGAAPSGVVHRYSFDVRA